MSLPKLMYFPGASLFQAVRRASTLGIQHNIILLSTVVDLTTSSQNTTFRHTKINKNEMQSYI